MRRNPGPFKALVGNNSRKDLRFDDNSRVSELELRRMEILGDRELWTTEIIASKGNAYKCMAFMAFCALRGRSGTLSGSFLLPALLPLIFGGFSILNRAEFSNAITSQIVVYYLALQL